MTVRSALSLSRCLSLLSPLLPCGLFPFVLSIPLYLGIQSPIRAEALSIEAFTDNSRFPVVWRVKPDVAQDVKAAIYDLATPKHIGQMLSVGLPANPEAARILAEQSIKANRNSLTSELKSAYQGHTKAMDYGLTHYPALVFNGKAVIYGISDVEEGIKRYQTWQAAQRR